MGVFTVGYEGSLGGEYGTILGSIRGCVYGRI